jgi:hypothetical protein
MKIWQVRHHSNRSFQSDYRLVSLIVATETPGKDVPLIIIRYLTRVLQLFVAETSSAFCPLPLAEEAIDF